MAIKPLFILKNKAGALLLLCLFAVCFFINTSAQTPFSFGIKNGKMIIKASKNLTQKQIDSVSYKYKIGELMLHAFIEKNFTDSLTNQGWLVESNDDKWIVITKSFDLNELYSSKSKEPYITPVLKNTSPFLFNNKYLLNRFKKDFVPYETDSTITLTYKSNRFIKEVFLAGSFTNWRKNALKMIKQNDNEFKITIPLLKGKHFYKFIIDNEWYVDPMNEQVESDSEGNNNSLLCKSNTTFFLPNYHNAKKVYLAGSFNKWQDANIKMIKTDSGWMVNLFLVDGNYTYRFIVDDQWVDDPQNPLKYPNEFYGQFNSVKQIGKQSNFYLKGFSEAKKVTLVGSFNDFRDYELLLDKIDSGWVTNYVVENGSHIYGFKVDNSFVNQQGEIIKSIEEDGTTLVINANHTFNLQGFKQAKKVYVAGNFNGWKKNATVMKLVNGVWMADVFLPTGKNLYKFIVDGNWIIDPKNPLWENNEYNNGNSIIWKE